jgi:hypothetical protein
MARGFRCFLGALAAGAGELEVGANLDQKRLPLENRLGLEARVACRWTGIPAAAPPAARLAGKRPIRAAVCEAAADALSKAAACAGELSRGCAMLEKAAAAAAIAAAWCVSGGGESIIGGERVESGMAPPSVFISPLRPLTGPKTIMQILI